MNRKKIIDQYFDRIDTLSDENRIALRRSCGKMINELDAYTLSMFYRYIPDFVVNNSLNKWLLATCIHCLWNNNEKSQGEVDRLSVEEALKFYRAENNSNISESFEKRIHNLLDTPWDEYGFMADKYLKIVKMLRQKGYAIDGRCILEDLLFWDSDSRIVQRRWAKTLNSNYKEEE